MIRPDRHHGRAPNHHSSSLRRSSYLIECTHLTRSSQELFAQFSIARVCGAWTARYYDVHAARNTRHCGAENLSQPPSHRVTLDRAADLLGDREAQSGTAHAVGKGVNGNKPPSVHRTKAINPLELERGRQAGTLASGQRSDGQPLAPPPAPRGDDPTAPGSTHTLAKPVGLGSLPAVWLVRALHGTPRWLIGTKS